MGVSQVVLGVAGIAVTLLVVVGVVGAAAMIWSMAHAPRDDARRRRRAAARTHPR